MSNHLAERPTTTDRVAKWIRRLCVPIVLFWLAITILSNALCPNSRQSAPSTTWR